MSTSGLVTILFTDLVGSTDLTTQIGDVAADELRRDHFSDLRAATAATGGTEVKTIGDAVMVSFTSAADALSGAVAMQRAIDRRNRNTEGPPLAMRIGLSAGDAAFEDGDWFGTCVIEASRLCASADGGQILVSDLVRALAGSRSDADVTPLGTRVLKGLPEPVAVCEVRWTAAENEHEIPLPGFVDTVPSFPFAGRSVPRETLTKALKEASEGDRRVVLVSGEPGVGKTRLVTEVVRGAHADGAVVLWGRCDEELEVPYQPWIEALRHYVFAAPADRLAAELGSLGGELLRLIPDLDQLTPGLDAPVHTESETARHRLFEAIGDLLEAVTRSSPVVMVIDDLHWADKPSLLLLRHLLRRPPTSRLLILATYRDTDLDRSHPLADVLADLRREIGVERVDLQGLDGGEVTSFMEGAAGHDLAESALGLAEAIHRETEGNPFFIGEMLRHLAESGQIVQRDGRWESDYTLDDVGIPEGIREVVGRRLSNLSDAANTALSIAAVIGPEFDFSVIDATGAIEGDTLLDALDEAVAASIVREIPDAFGRYAFAHALVRSTLYEELGTNRRVRLHWQVAQAIEARHANDLDRHLDSLAHHFTEGALAGDARTAVGYAQRAAERALDDLAYEGAAQQYERAIGALELLAQPDPPLHFDLQLGRCKALRAASDQRSRDAGFTAAAIARAMEDTERLALAAVAMTGAFTTRMGTLDEEIIQLLESGLDAIGDAPSPIRSRLLSGLAVELQWGPEGERRRRLASEALEMARTTGDPEALLAVLLQSWALVDCSTPFLDQIRDLNLEAAEQLRDDPVAAIVSERPLLYIAAARGDREAADRHLASLIERAEALRQPRHITMARNDDAMFTGLYGDLAGSEAKALAAFQYGQEHGILEENLMAPLGALLYYVRRGQGRQEELIPSIEQLVESQPGAPVWRVALAGALSESGRSDEAVEHVEFLAADDCARVPPDIQYPVTLCGIARLSRTVPLDDRAMEHVYTSLLPFSGTFNWSGASITDANDHGLGMLAARRGEFELSGRHFAAAIDLCERSGARCYLATARLDWARMLHERGEHEGAAEQAWAALELAEALEMTGPHGIARDAREILADLGG